VSVVEDANADFDRRRVRVLRDEQDRWRMKVMHMKAAPRCEPCQCTSIIATKRSGIDEGNAYEGGATV
jgi:hypothetical protein